jgi:hypothetical protein
VANSPYLVSKLTFTKSQRFEKQQHDTTTVLNFGGSFGAERKVQVCAQIHQGCSIPHAVAEALPATGRFMAMCFDPSGASVQGLLRVVRDSRNWNVFFFVRASLCDWKNQQL